MERAFGCFFEKDSYPNFLILSHFGGKIFASSMKSKVTKGRKTKKCIVEQMRGCRLRLSITSLFKREKRGQIECKHNLVFSRNELSNSNILNTKFKGPNVRIIDLKVCDFTANEYFITDRLIRGTYSLKDTVNPPLHLNCKTFQTNISHVSTLNVV